MSSLAGKPERLFAEPVNPLFTRQRIFNPARCKTGSNGRCVEEDFAGRVLAVDTTSAETAVELPPGTSSVSTGSVSPSSTRGTPGLNISPGQPMTRTYLIARHQRKGHIVTMTVDRRKKAPQYNVRASSAGVQPIGLYKVQTSLHSLKR